MKKMAIVVDSSCGLSRKQIEELGWYFLPLKIELDGKIYDDGDNLLSTELFNHFSLDTKTYKTSCTPIGHVEEMIEKLSAEYENIVVFPISKHLSSQYQNLKVMESVFAKLKVFDSQYISILTLMRIFYFIDLVEKEGFSIDQALEKSAEWTGELSVSLVPKYNDYLVKGGRLSPSAATVAKLLKIVPIIAFDKGKLEKEGKGRIFTKAICNNITAKLENDNNTSDIIILHNDSPDYATIKSFVESNFPNDVYTSNLPNCISIHTGPEAIVIIKSTKKLHDSLKKVINA
ncbi:DegV family protein [Mycoplasma sp. Pen4]|uniref:DegV family protein n=1 Tax=Mycoplasma sp. Pen4 TaxID=640330 RepID=UPI0016548A23|nr:DegV family protein [Mycoplasma sp. Pen4]QNM93949.1 DegV family protein [Mycoplasma sp. Pen4]